MIKYVIFSVCLLLFSQTVFADYEIDLDRLERNKYGEIYSDESISQRLERLERDYFGLEQSGDIEHRINMLNRMNVHSVTNSIIPQVEPELEKKKGIKRFWNDFKSSFSDDGVITGFTPPITSYGYTNDFYTNNPNGYNNFFNGRNNFLNNRNNFCPYHNRYHYNNYGNFPYGINNRINNLRHTHNRISNNFHPGIIPPPPGRIQPPINRYGNNYRNAYYNMPQRIPTNSYSSFSTGSRIHIIND